MPSCITENPCNNSTANKTNEQDFYEYEVDGKKWFLPPGWSKQSEGIRNFAMRPDDIWIMTQPRSGTTLTQELVWLLTHNLDFETAKKFHLVDRSPEFGVSLFPELWNKCHIIRPSVEDPKILESVPVDTSKYSYEVYADLPSPRVFKTHLALSVHKGILDSGCKVIYVLRNPKDSLVSRARFACCGNNPLYKGSIESLLKTMIHNETKGVVPYLPFWPHVKEAWSQRNHPNLLFMYYEEFRTDLLAAVKKIAAFLGKKYSDEKLDDLVLHLDINKFRENPMVNSLPGMEDRVSTFIGNGRIGGWDFSPELESDYDRWIEENASGTDIARSYLKKKTTNIET